MEHPGSAAGERREQFLMCFRGHRRRRLAVGPKQLLPVREVPGFHRCLPPRLAFENSAVARQFIEQIPYLHGFGVIASHGKKTHRAAQRSQISHRVARAPQHRLAAFDSQHRDRSLRRNPAHLAMHEGIEHHVPGADNRRRGHSLDDGNKNLLVSQCAVSHELYAH